MNDMNFQECARCPVRNACPMEVCPGSVMCQINKTNSGKTHGDVTGGIPEGSAERSAKIMDGIMIMVNEDGVAEVYDDTYDIMIHCTSEEEQERCERILKGDNWIPVENRLPETDDYILLSFENFDVPLVGRYEADEDGGGKFYVGDDEESCISADLYVNAWMPLPKLYRAGD